MNNFFTIIMFEIHLQLEIMIYKKIDEFVVTQLRQIMKIYSTFWKNHERTMKLLKSKYLRMFFVIDWKNKINKLFIKIYSLNKSNKQFVDEIFDKFHKQSKMNWMIQFISFDFFNFVVWKITVVNDQFKKKYVIMNIRNLNRMIQFDFLFYFCKRT